MKKKILVNAIYPEEKRVAIIEGETLTDFFVESAEKEQLKGNIYKGVIARIEPGLQAVFVNFGPKKHGFLQMREIKPEYHQKQIEGKRPRVQDVLSKGQELIVQVEKDERDTKGASLTTYLSLPGRYLVMIPGEERMGISRKIEDREDRSRIKDILSTLKLPKDMGFILRTAGMDKGEEELSQDLQYLTKLWSRIQADSKKAAAPALIYQEHDIAVRTVRDYLMSDIHEVLIDDPATLKTTKEFLKKTVPWRKINVKVYREKKPIFTKFNIEDQIAKIYERHIHLPSRGYLVFDKAEALTAIDVNSGKSRKEEHIEATALRTNLEAADEIARQIRLRDIGGQIVIDFIDMMSSKNRREVENRLRTALTSDKAHVETSGISKFGLLEMTRERLRPAFLEAAHRRCESCGGTGVVRTHEILAVSALREMHSRAARDPIREMTCRLPAESLNYLLNMKRDEVFSIEKEYRMKLRLLADASLVGVYAIDVKKDREEEKEEEKSQEKTAEKPQARRQERHKDRPQQKQQVKPQEEPEEKPQEEATEEKSGETPVPETAGEPQKQKKRGRRRQRPWQRRRGKGKEKQPGETAGAEKSGGEGGTSGPAEVS